MLCLSPIELEQLTLKKTPGRQSRVLKHIGVPFRVRPDGSLILLRIHLEVPYDVRTAPREPKLNFGT